MDSILTSVKKQLGIEEDYTHFDPDIIEHINSVFMTLKQLGVGPDKAFRISDASAKWSDFIPEDSDLEAVKTYMGLKVGMIFDPPTSGILTESKNKLISEFEWRLNVEAETSY